MYESAGITNAGAGPRKPIASMSATNAPETASDAEYRAAPSSAASAIAARIAASGVTRSPRSDSASPASPAATRRPARAVARLGWGRLGASITCGKLARDGTYGAPPRVVSVHGDGAVDVGRLARCPAPGGGGQ